MERLTGVPPSNSLNSLSPLERVIVELKGEIKDLREKEREFKVDSLNINVVKAVSYLLGAIGITYSITSAYTGIRSDLQAIREQQARTLVEMQKDRERVDEKVSLIQGQLSDKTKDSFTIKDAEELTFRLCVEIERTTGKKIRCPYRMKELKEEKG